MKPALFGAAYP